MVRQIPDQDFTEPLFEVSLRAKDDKSDVTLFLNVGTRPGDSDVLKERPLGGQSTIIKDVRFKRRHFLFQI